MEIKAKAMDIATVGLITNPSAGDAAQAIGHYVVECYDKDRNLKWTAESKNLVVNVGLQYMAGVALTSTTQITSWYVGLYGAGASNTPAAGDTMGSHAGWTEVTDYSNATRVAATFAAATLPTGSGNPSVVTNSASKAQFDINGTTTVGGAFLVGGPTSSTKGGASGTLFSAADFASPGDRSVVNGDILLVTYTFSLSA
jgi:hypothetical protein